MRDIGRVRRMYDIRSKVEEKRQTRRKEMKRYERGYRNEDR